MGLAGLVLTGSARQGHPHEMGELGAPSAAHAPTQAKAAGLYMICTPSQHMAEAEGFDDALVLDWRGQLAEGTGANIFLVINGELHTPTPDCFLNGITRQTVIGLARGTGDHAGRTGQGQRGFSNRLGGGGDTSGRDCRRSRPLPLYPRYDLSVDVGGL